METAADNNDVGATANECQSLAQGKEVKSQQSQAHLFFSQLLRSELGTPKTH